MENEQMLGRIRELLKNRNETTSHMLMSIGLNKSYLSDMASKNTTPSVDAVMRIASYLGVSIDFIILGSDICGHISDGSNHLNSDEAKLLNRYSSLDEDGQDVVRVATLNEWRRMEQIKSLGVSVNPNPPPVTPGRDEAMVRPGTSPPGRVKRPQTKPKRPSETDE